MLRIFAKQSVFIFFSLLLTVLAMPLAAEQGVIVRSAALRADSSFLATTLKALTPGTVVETLERRGGWQQVRVTGARSLQGWVRVYQVRTDIAPQTGSEAVVMNTNEGGVLTSLSSLSRSASNMFGQRDTGHQNTVVATIGIRGLSEEDLAKAKPDMEELKQMLATQVKPQEAQAYAKSAGLQAHSLEELAAPEETKQ